MNEELEIRNKKQSFCFPVRGEWEPGIERLSNREVYVLMAPSVPGDMAGFQSTHGRKLQPITKPGPMKGPTLNKRVDS